MTNDDMERLLNEVEKPTVRLPAHEARLRLAYMNARTSAWWGIPLLLLPIAFVAASLLKSVAGIAGPFDRLEPLIAAIDQVRIGPVPLSAILILGGLATALLLNVLAVTHLHASREDGDVVLELAIKRKPLNFVLLAIAVVILCLLLAYGIGENFQARPH
jgi:hypothetical protein